MKITETPPSDRYLSRRGWIKRYMLGSVVTPTCAAVILAEVADAAPVGPAMLRLRVTDHTALQAVGGSVQLQFSGIYPPMMVNRVTTTEFAALDSVCKHSGCTVNKYVAANGYMQCPCHGSRYDARGVVVRGPAAANMNSFITSYDAAANVVTVEVPGLGLDVRSISIQSDTGGTTRFRLDFQVTAFSTYQVRFRSDLEGLFAVVPFSLTAEGPANQTSLQPNDDGVRTVYVDATGDRGFFVVSLTLTEV